MSCLYRPFDVLPIYYHPDVIDWPRPEVMRHMLAGKNLGLIFMRQVALDEGYSHFCVSRYPADNRAFVSNKGTMQLGPLYVYPDNTELLDLSPWKLSNNGRRPNLSQLFVRDLETKLSISFLIEGRGDLENTFGPEDVLYYAYGIFHSPNYRSRYEEFLKMDFPRLPVTGNLELFKVLARLGGELVALHLLESPKLNNLITRFVGDGDNSIPKKPTYKDGAVWINAGQRFDGVPEAVWTSTLAATRYARSG